jgi:hypothetical protein
MKALSETPSIVLKEALAVFLFSQAENYNESAF